MVIAAGGAVRSAQLLGGRVLYSFRLRSSSFFVPPASSILRLDYICISPARWHRRQCGEISTRLVPAFLFTLGKDLLCFPVSFPFRTGGAAAGCGLSSGHHLRTGGGGAILGLSGVCNRFYKLVLKSSWVLATTCSGGLPPL
jgi:hypothetical protein